MSLDLYAEESHQTKQVSHSYHYITVLVNEKTLEKERGGGGGGQSIIRRSSLLSRISVHMNKKKKHIPFFLFSNQLFLFPPGTEELEAQLMSWFLKHPQGALYSVSFSCSTKKKD